MCEIRKVQLNGCGIAVRFTGDLGKDPVAPTGFGQHNGRAKLGRRQVREREVNYDDLAGCKCAHAASSSGRFQSSARAASLKRGASWTDGASSRIVTSA